jgi:hypothetical protein
MSIGAAAVKGMITSMGLLGYFSWALETSLQITQEARIATIAHNTELLTLLDFMSLPPLVNDVSKFEDEPVLAEDEIALTSLTHCLIP